MLVIDAVLTPGVRAAGDARPGYGAGWQATSTRPGRVSVLRTGEGAAERQPRRQMVRAVAHGRAGGSGTPSSSVLVSTRDSAASGRTGPRAAAPSRPRMAAALLDGAAGEARDPGRLRPAAGWPRYLLREAMEGRARRLPGRSCSSAWSASRTWRCCGPMATWPGRSRGARSNAWRRWSGRTGLSRPWLRAGALLLGPQRHGLLRRWTSSSEAQAQGVLAEVYDDADVISRVLDGAEESFVELGLAMGKLVAHPAESAGGSCSNCPAAWPR